MAGSLKLDGSEFLVKEGGQFKITNSELKLKSSGNTVVDSSGNAVISESGGNVTLGNVRLPASGGIKNSSGNNVLSESGGKVSLSDDVIHGPTMIDVYFNNADINTHQTLTTLTRLTNSNSNSSFEPFGTGMTFNSGIFSFPSTGYYEIKGQLYLYSIGGSGGFVWAGVTMYMNKTGSTDATYNGLTGWNQVSGIFDSAHAAAGYGAAYLQGYIKVTDTTQDRIKMIYNSTNTNGRLAGSSTYTGTTHFSFIKLRGL